MPSLATEMPVSRPSNGGVRPLQPSQLLSLHLPTNQFTIAPDYSIQLLLTLSYSPPLRL
jgi:hypothetical protein